MAKPTDSQRQTLATHLSSYFTSQASMVLGRISDGEDDWWGDNWDDDLAAVLSPLMVDLAAETGRKVASDLDHAYDPGRTEAFLAAVAARHATTINDTTRAQLADTLGSDNPDPAHVFDIAQNSRADGISAGQATFLAAFGTHEAAAQKAYDTGGTATKTWVTGPNPRPEHAAMDGETVGLDDVFSNGMPYPGDGDDPAQVANCNCSVDVEVDVPNAQNRARMLVARARQRTRDSAPRRMYSLAPGVVTIRLYDVITDWGWPFGVSAKDFAATLDELPDNTTQIQLHINSPGGDTTEAVAIMNQLRAHPAGVVCIVDGLAASAASVIAAGSGRTVMLPNTEMMIHDAWGICVDNADGMTKTAEILNHVSDNVAAAYAAKAGGTAADWRTIMREEAWYTPDEAVQAGLADEVGDPAQYPMSGDAPEPPPSEEEFEALDELFSLAGFRFAGRAKAPTPKTPVASASGQPSSEGSAVVDLNDQHITTLRQQIGFAEDADADTIVAAVVEALTEQAEPAPQTSMQPPDGMVLVSQAKYDEDRASYTALAAQVQGLLDEKAQTRREDKVKSALRAGKIMPAEKQAYLNALQMDEEGTTARLDALTPGIVPFTEAGYDNGSQAETGDPHHQPGWSDKHFNQKAS